MENQQEALLGTAITISEEAGKAVMDIYSNGDFETTYKKEDSPLTLADMASHNIIVQQLKKKTPDIPVLSEESENIPYDVRKSWTTFWLVDPLDGTKEFINRNGEFTVNVALIDSGKTILGVVHAPVLRTTYYASTGKGAFKKNYVDDGKPSQIHVSDYHNGRLIIVTTRSHSNNKLENFKRNVGDAEFTSMGSSLKLCLVAEGKAHLYPRLGPTMEWDTAAAQCIVESAGGTVTDLCKQTLNYNKPNLLNPFFMVSGSPPFPWWDYIDKI